MAGTTETINVLHVDDAPDIVNLVTQCLEREDDRIEVQTGTSVEEGLELLADQTVDCIVSDYEMPGRNGIEFLESVREEYPDLPFILYTGKGSEEIASDAISAGITDYLQKEGGIDQYAVLANRVTNAVEARQAERRQGRQLDAIESAQEGISILDADGQFIYVNEIYADLYGYDREEMLGEHWELVYQSDDVPEIHGTVLPTVEEEGYWQGTTTGLRADGSTFVEEHVLAQSDRGELVCTVRDISEREERMQELDRAQNLLEETEQIADVGGWEIDTETMDVFWTENLFELLGKEGNKAPPLEEALTIYHEADRSVVEEAIEEALETGDPFDVEVRYRRPEGEVRWLQVRGTPEMRNGEVRVLRGAVKDITERQSRETVLREMYEIISDPDRSFEGQTRALLELGRSELGTEYGTLSEIRGDTYIFDTVAGEDDRIHDGKEVPVSSTNCEIVAETEQTIVLGDVERDAPAETDRIGFTDYGISSYIGAPVYAEDGLYGTFCFYDTEARADQFSDWEETLVDLMSRWMSHEIQRRQANEQLQARNKQLEQFASIVSHDLRNPLNVASLRLNLAMDECDNEHLDNVEQAHERMEELIDDLLELALEGKKVSETEPVELGEVVEYCRENVVTRDVTLLSTVDQPIGADRSRLQQLIENLIRNAVEHGGEGVTVTVGQLNDGFYLEDDGPGIPADEREDIFEPGYSTSEDGTGFGLSIVKQVASAHDWEINITDGSDGGARFEISGVEFSGK